MTEDREHLSENGTAVEQAEAIAAQAGRLESFAAKEE